MTKTTKHRSEHAAAILNAGSGAWALEDLSDILAQVTGLPISTTPHALNYVLGWDEPVPPSGRSFVPYESVRLASDKRLLAEVFARHGIATPPRG